MQHKFLLMFLAAMPLTGVSQPLHTLMEDLTQSNAQIQAETSALAAERERLKQARAAFLPNIQFSAATGLNSNSNEDRYRNHTFTITQPLFAGGRDHAAYTRITANISAKEAQLTSLIQQQKVALADAYLSLISAKAQKEQTTQYVDVLTQSLMAQEVKFESGEASRIDVMQAKAFLERGKADDATAGARIQSAVHALENLMAAPLPDTFTPAWPEALMIPDSEEMLLSPLEKHPDMRAINEDLVAAKATVRSAYGELLPTLNAKATRNDYAWSATPDNQTVGLSLSLPIFQGGRNVSQVRQARHLEQAARDRAYSTRQTLEQNALTAWENARASALNLTALSAAKDAQAEATRGIQARYEQGESSLLDLLEAEQDLLQAQTAKTEAKRTHLLNTYRLKAAMGEL